MRLVDSPLLRGCLQEPQLSPFWDWCENNCKHPAIAKPQYARSKRDSGAVKQDWSTNTRKQIRVEIGVGEPVLGSLEPASLPSTRAYGLPRNSDERYRPVRDRRPRTNRVLETPAARAHLPIPVGGRQISLLRQRHRPIPAGSHPQPPPHIAHLRPRVLGPRRQRQRTANRAGRTFVDEVLA